MEKDFSASSEQVRNLFNETFKSTSANQRVENFIDDLRESMFQWISETNRMMKAIVDKKIEDIEDYYKAFQAEVEQQFRLFEKRQENGAESFPDLEHFYRFCVTNRFEERLKFSIDEFKRADLEARIKIKYEPMPSDADVPPLTPIPRIKSTLTQNYQTPKDIHEAISSASSMLDDFKPIPSIETPIRRISTNAFDEQDNVKVPILINKNRDFTGDDKRHVEYSIDSLFLSKSSASNGQQGDAKTLLSDFQQLLNERNSSNGESNSARRRNETSSVRSFDQDKHSMILLKEFKSEFNCLASSTKSNELILFNSNLNVLLILKHEDDGPCRERSYFEWFDKQDKQILDISYSAYSQQYVMIGNKNRIFLFDPKTFSVIEIEQVPPNTQFRRVQPVQQKVFFLDQRNSLLEAEFVDQYRMNFLLPMKFFDGDDRFNSTGTLLDLSSDNEILLVVYTINNDQIRARAIRLSDYRQLDDIQIEEPQPIDQNKIRIEFVPRSNSQRDERTSDFLYLNGNKRFWRIIQFKNQQLFLGEENFLSETPTNCVFLHDSRMILLHEQPKSFLSVHKKKRSIH